MEFNYSESVENLDRAQDARWELQRRQADDSTLFDRTRALVDEKSSSLLELESMLAVTKQDKSLQGKELKRLQQARKHIHNELTAAGDTLNKYENGMQLAIEERETILEDQRSIKGQLQILDEQLAFYMNLLRPRKDSLRVPGIYLKTRRNFLMYWEL